MEATGNFRGIPWYEKAPRDPGTDCTECGRLKKTYHRRLSSSMARGLIRLYRLHRTYPETKAFHVKLFDKEGARGEFGVLSCWSLVQEVKRHDKDQKTSGMWSMTEFGAQFVQLEERVPMYVMLRWGSKLMGFTGPWATAKECLERGGKFSYAELMGWKPELTQEQLFA